MVWIRVNSATTWKVDLWSDVCWLATGRRPLFRLSGPFPQWGIADHGLAIVIERELAN